MPDTTSPDGAIVAADPVATSTLRPRLLTGLCWFMAFEFVVGGLAKFLPGETFFGPPYDERFVDWGYPSWFRFVVGAGEIVAGVLLTTRHRFVGAAILVVVLTGATVTHIVNADPASEATSAPFHLVLALVVAWATRPRHDEQAPGVPA